MEWSLSEKIGKGGNGIVFRASSAEYPQAAVKFLTSFRGDHFSRFETEIKALKACQGENIVPILDSGYLEYQGKPIPFYAMPVYRTSLRGLLQRYPAGLKTEICLALFEKLLGALETLHSQGILHRDIKPENILIDEKGDPYLADFGLAKAYSKKAQALLGYGLTRTNHKAAPANYMSPEQLLYLHDKRVNLDERSDLFQLGKVFYECLTGNNPLGQVSPPRPDDQEHLFRHIIAPLIRQNPEERPSHAGEVYAKLQRLKIYAIERSESLASGEILWTEALDETHLQVWVGDATRVVRHQVNWEHGNLETQASPLPENLSKLYPLFDLESGHCLGYASLRGSYPEQEIVYAYNFLNQQGKLAWSEVKTAQLGLGPKEPEVVGYSQIIAYEHGKKVTREHIPEFYLSSLAVSSDAQGNLLGLTLIGRISSSFWVIRLKDGRKPTSYRKFQVPGSDSQHDLPLYSVNDLTARTRWLAGTARIQVSAFYAEQGAGGGIEENVILEDQAGAADTPWNTAANKIIKLQPADSITSNLKQTFTGEQFSLETSYKGLTISDPKDIFPAYRVAEIENKLGFVPGQQVIHVFRKASAGLKVERYAPLRPSPVQFD